MQNTSLIQSQFNSNRKDICGHKNNINSHQQMATRPRDSQKAAPAAKT